MYRKPSKIGRLEYMLQKNKKIQKKFQKSVDIWRIIAYNLSCCCGTRVKNLRNNNKIKPFGVWLSLARALDLGSRGRRFESCHPDLQFNILCGCSSMVEH